MSSISEWYAKDGKRMLDSRLTFIEWEEKDTMSVADLWQTSKKFKDYVDDYHVTQGLLRQTDELERDIVRLEHLIYSIQNKMYAF
jgi:recombinational DNA repair protein RecR